MGRIVVKFDFNGHNIDVLGTETRPEFHGLQSARSLGYANPSAALYKVPEADYAKRMWRNARGELRPTIFLYEPGLYRLIFGSQLDSAEQFKDWVFRTVIPTYRQLLVNRELTQNDTRRPFAPQYLKEVQEAINSSGMLRGEAYLNIYRAQGVEKSIKTGLTRKPKSSSYGYDYYDENGKYVKSLHQRLSELGLDDNLTHQIRIITAYELADGDKVALRKYLTRLGTNVKAINREIGA
jgi:hypothetical protein